jgi:hypothetical protein
MFGILEEIWRTWEYSYGVVNAVKGTFGFIKSLGESVIISGNLTQFLKRYFSTSVRLLEEFFCVKAFWYSSG